MNELKKYQINNWKSINKITTIKDFNLRDYQTDIAYEAMYNLISLGVCYLNLQMRTGKSIISLATASLFCKNKENVLFVTKVKAISSVQSDYKKLINNFNLTIINYESLHKIEKKFFKLIIIDEAHCIGAFPKPSERYNSLRKLIDKHTNLILLSGTASPESFSQLYHQFRLSDTYSPFKQYKSFYQFAKEFVTVKQKKVGHDKFINDYSNCNWDKLQPILDKYFIRYTQEAAGFEQTINEQILKVDMKPTTYSLIERLKKDLVVTGKEHTILCDTKVKLLNKLHQLYSGTIIFECGEGKIIDTSKADFIKDNFFDQHIAIFYKFKLEGELLKKTFPNYTEDANEFNTTDKTFIGQIQSVKEGVNLSSAESIINYNLDFSSTTYQQARERASHKDRITENNVYFIMATNGIEQDIYKAVQNKQDYTLAHFTKEKIFKNDRIKVSNLFN